MSNLPAGDLTAAGAAPGDTEGQYVTAYARPTVATQGDLPSGTALALAAAGYPDGHRLVVIADTTQHPTGTVHALSGATWTATAEVPLKWQRIGASQARQVPLSATVDVTAINAAIESKASSTELAVERARIDIVASRVDETADSVPKWTPRTNKRYIAPNGDNTADGLTRTTPWASLQPNVANVPADTEVIYLDGDYVLGSNLYTSRVASSTVGDGVTIRADSYRGATVRGVASPAVSDDGIAVLLIDSVVDLEIWGLEFEDWAGGGAGLMLVEGDVEGFRVIGNRCANNGSIGQHHFVYFSGSASTLNTAARDWVVSHNDVVMAPGSGAFVSLRNGPFGAHSGVIRGNTVRGEGLWGMIVNDTRADGAQSNILVAENDFDGKFSAGVIQFGNYTTPSPLNGVDETFVIDGNKLRNRSTANNAFAMWRWPEIGGGKAQHAPTLRRNVLEVLPSKGDKTQGIDFDGDEVAALEAAIDALEPYASNTTTIALGETDYVITTRAEFGTDAHWTLDFVIRLGAYAGQRARADLFAEGVSGPLHLTPITIGPAALEWVKDDFDSKVGIRNLTDSNEAVKYWVTRTTV